MKKMQKILFMKLIVLSLMFSLPVIAGNDVVTLTIDGYKYGQVQWQKSTNGTVWSNIKDSVRTTLVINDTLPAYYKARVNYGTCNPWYSGVYITGSEEPSMVLVSGGSFSMGTTSEKDPNAYNNEKPSHQVVVDTFYISRYEITNIQFAKFLNDKTIGADGIYITSEFASQTLVKPHKWSLEFVNSKWRACIGYELFPVVNVTWFGANEYCTWAGGRLPNEAEWEFAARGGMKSKQYLYSGSNDINVVGWYKTNSIDKTRLIGGKIQNELGIYDMTGNVWEWCNDWYKDDLTSAIQATNQYKVFRGGSCYTLAPLTRNTLRYYGNPAAIYNSLGFRLCMSKTN